LSFEEENDLIQVHRTSRLEMSPRHRAEITSLPVIYIGSL